MVKTPRTDAQRRLELAALLTSEIAAAAIRRGVSVSAWEENVARTSRSTTSKYRKGNWSDGEPRPAKLTTLIEDIYPSDTESRNDLRRRVWDVMGWGVEIEDAPPLVEDDEPDLSRRPKTRSLLRLLADPLVPESTKDRLDRRIGFMLLEEEVLGGPGDSGQSEVDEAL